MDDARDDPGAIVRLLGDRIPNVAYYLATLIIVKSLGSIMVELARPVPAFTVFTVRRIWNGKTLSMRELTSGARAPPVLDYGEKYPDLLLVLLICLFYSCISPFITLFGILYFALAYLVYSNQFLYVYVSKTTIKQPANQLALILLLFSSALKFSFLSLCLLLSFSQMPPFDAGGVLWYQVFRKCIVAIVLMQLTLAGVLSLKLGTGQVAFLTPLPFLTLYRASSVLNKYEKSSGQLSLSQAVAMDRHEDALAAEGATDECSPCNFTGTEYVQPALFAAAAEPAPYRDAAMVVDGEIYGTPDWRNPAEGRWARKDGGEGGGGGGAAVDDSLEATGLEPALESTSQLQEPLIPQNSNSGSAAYGAV